MMKKRMLGVIAVLLVCIFALSACKKEAGKPVDNAVSENTTDDSEDTDQTEDAGKYKFGFSVIDMQNPYFITLEEAAQQIVEKEECTMVVKDPASDADTQAEQIREMINEG
ncbi:MAG: sugar ABC transporter substrate-binding protein, partial [Dorea sp.]